MCVVEELGWGARGAGEERGGEGSDIPHICALNNNTQSSRMWVTGAGQSAGAGFGVAGNEDIVDVGKKRIEEVCGT